MKVLYKAMKVVVRPLQKCELEGFVARTREVEVWKCVPLRTAVMFSIVRTCQYCNIVLR